MMGWSQWLALIIPMVGSGLFGGAIATWVKTRPAMKTAQVQGEAALWGRISALEASQERERDMCDERINRIEERADAAMAELKGEIQVLRHDRNNVRQGFNALLAMLKRIEHPEIGTIVQAIEEMVARGDEQIALERGAMKGMRT